MGLFSRNRSKDAAGQNREMGGQIPVTAGERFIQELGKFSSWKSSSEFKAIKTALEKMETEKDLDAREKASEELGKACQEYLNLRKGNSSESGKQKYELAQQVLSYQQFTACEVYHDQIKAMDNQMVTMESAMKITQYSKKFQDAYEDFQNSPRKSVIDIGKRNQMQQQYEDHLEINVDAVRSKPKLEEAIRQNKPWGQLSFPVPLVNSMDGANKVGNAMSARSVVTIKGKKGVFTEYTDMTIEKVAENCISSMPPGEIQNALGNHFEDVVELFKGLMTVNINGTKEGKKIKLKTQMYNFMNRKLEEGDLETQKEKYKDLIDVIETTEFGDVLAGMADRAKEFNAINKTLANNDKEIKKKGDFDKRNELTSRMADALGMGNLVAHSERIKMVRNGKVVEGNFMEFAEGYDVKSHDDEKRKMLSEAVLDDPGFQRDINRMEVFDYLCGQGDRHDGNMIYTLGEPGADGKRRITGIKGIDNDDSFIHIVRGGELSYDRPIELIPAVDRELADEVRKLDRQQLEFYLGDVLSKNDMDWVEKRLNNMKEHFKTCAMVEKEDWEKDVSAVKDLRDTKGGLYQGIKEFGHLPERGGSAKLALDAERGANLEADQKKLDTASKRYHDKVKTPELGQDRKTRLKMDIRELEKITFKEIRKNKKQFHQQKTAAPQNTQKTQTKQERTMGK